MSKPKRYKHTLIRKWQGDDCYSWAVFRRGQSKPAYCGLGRHEARYYRDLVEQSVAARVGTPPATQKGSDQCES